MGNHMNVLKNEKEKWIYFPVSKEKKKKKKSIINVYMMLNALKFVHEQFPRWNLYSR